MSAIVQCRSSSSSREPPLQPVVELVEVLLGLRDQPIEARDGLPLDLAVQEVGELELLAVDQRVRGRSRRAARSSRSACSRSPATSARNGCNARSSRNCSTAARSGRCVVVGAGVPAGAGTSPSRKMVGWRTIIAARSSVSTTNRRRWSVLPRPSLIEAANTSSRAGPFALEVEEDRPPLQVIVRRGRATSSRTDLEQRVARRDPFQGRVRREERLVEGDLAVVAAEPPEAGLQPLADGHEGARHLADAVDVAVLARPPWAGRPDSGPACDEEVLDDLGHEPPLPRLGRLADDGREVQFPLRQPFQRRLGDLPGTGRGRRRGRCGPR